jgi:NAD(P)-dependent dehydrogenase (short-subunit alcohol dehydrogenase family)
MTSKFDRAQFLRAAGAVTVLAAAGRSMAAEVYRSSWPEATLKQLRHPSLKDRVVLITGGSRGFGWLIAEELLKGGAKVALTARGEAALKAVAADIESRYGKGRCVTVAGDVSQQPDCARMVDATLDGFGRIDVLINNAGRSPQDFGGGGAGAAGMVRFYETPDEALHTIIDTNFKGVWYMSKAAAPHMVKRKFGKIISVSTSASNMVRAGNPIYGPGKAALEAMTRVWAQELKGTGVDANIILPGGAADTSFIKQAVVAGAVGERSQNGRLLPADVIVPPAVWLCTDATNGVTGVRAVGRNWDRTASTADEAFSKCLDPHIDVPRIM